MATVRGPWRPVCCRGHEGLCFVVASKPSFVVALHASVFCGGLGGRSVL